MGYLEDRLARKNGIAPPLPTRKEKKPLAKVSKKRAAQIEEDKKKGSDDELWNFFLEMRKKMTGRCLFTGEKSFKHDDERFHFSIAHLLEKRNFKSVATHPENWIELSWDAHTDFDNGKISWDMLKDSAEWTIIKEKLLLVLPMVAEEERKHKLYSKLNELIYGK
jgi:hypothetical protein